MFFRHYLKCYAILSPGNIESAEKQYLLFQRILKCILILSWCLYYHDNYW